MGWAKAKAMGKGKGSNEADGDLKGGCHAISPSWRQEPRCWPFTSAEEERYLE